ncbi:MAG: flagellar protein FlaG [Sterolibacterium sp.]
MQITLTSTGNYPGIQSDVAVVRERPVAVELPVTKDSGSSSGSVDPKVLQAATDKINQTMQGLGNNLQFMFDSETSMNIVRVVDSSTKETIRQFPSEETLAIAKALDKLQGLLIRESA